jgi:cell wall-associated NlpC family hydrolase
VFKQLFFVLLVVTFAFCATDERLEHFKAEFFSSWANESEQNAAAALTGLVSQTKKSKFVGENLLPLSNLSFLKSVTKAEDALKNKIFKNAITVRNADIRILPTEKPFFKDPNLAGEGYPFDYLQNSRIYISTPLKLLYATPQKDYYFAKSPVGYGWIDARAVAFTDEVFESDFRTCALETPTKDKEPLYDANGDFIERLNVGTVLKKEQMPIRWGSGKAAWTKRQKLIHSSEMPMSLNEQAVALMAYSMYSEPYGWGGYLDNRDCSMFLRDIFVGFGVFLPRNSYEQAKGYTDISAMNKESKKTYIKANAKAWHTLIYLKGHIMLYVGTDSKGEPLVMHDAWGIKSFENGKEGRKMLGGVVVTTMEEGKGQPWFDNNKSSVLGKVLGIRDIY